MSTPSISGALTSTAISGAIAYASGNPDILITGLAFQSAGYASFIVQGLTAEVLPKHPRLQAYIGKATMLTAVKGLAPDSIFKNFALFQLAHEVQNLSTTAISRSFPNVDSRLIFGTGFALASSTLRYSSNYFQSPIHPISYLFLALQALGSYSAQAKV